jgi:hypothetical protein
MRRCQVSSRGSRVVLVTIVVVWSALGAFGAFGANSASAAEPTCPDVGGALRRDSTRDHRETKPDGTELWACGYALTDDHSGMTGGRTILAMWTPSTDRSGPPLLCAHTEGTLFDATKAVEVHYTFAGNNLPEFRQVAQSLLSSIEPVAASCPSSAAVTSGTPGQVSAPARGSHSGGFDPILGLAAGGVALAGAGTLGVRQLTRKRPGAAPPTPADVPSAIYDGQPATDLLVRQGWLAPVTRPDGSIGYQPLGDLEQFLDHDHGPWQPSFSPGTVGPDGNSVHELVGVALTPGADGMLDSVTVVTSVGNPAPAPAPAPPASQPTESGAMGLLAIDEIIDSASWKPSAWELQQIHDQFAAMTPSPGVPPPSVPTSPLESLLRSGGEAVITPDAIPRLVPQWFAPDGSLSVHGTFVDALLNGEHPKVHIDGGALDVKVAMHHARATFEARDGRVVAHLQSLEGPLGISVIEPDDLQEGLQHYLDTHLNGPAAANGLRVTDVHLADGAVHITTTPKPR